MSQNILRPMPPGERPHPASQWGSAIVVAAIITIAVGGAVFAVRTLGGDPGEADVPVMAERR